MINTIYHALANMHMQYGFLYFYSEIKFKIEVFVQSQQGALFLEFG